MTNRNVLWRNESLQRYSQGWTTGCGRIPERDGKDQGEDSLKQAGPCRFARQSCLATSGATLYTPGVWLADVKSSLAGATFVLFCFVFVFMLLLKPRPFVQSFFVLRYACVPTATRVFSFFPLFFLSFGDVAFSEYFSERCTLSPYG